MSEVLARLRAIERRRQGAQAASKVLTNGTMTLNCETKTVRLHAPEGDKEVALSKREFDLMEALMTRPGAILSRTTLEERLYGDGDMPESNALEFIIHGLRKSSVQMLSETSVVWDGWCTRDARQDDNL